MADVKAAQERLQGFINRTCLEQSDTLGNLCGNQIFLKPENLQKTGAFKIRGAANYIFQLDPQVGQRGVVTASSGNHGQAVAYAARLKGYPATVVVPTTVTGVKAAAIAGYGGQLLHHGDIAVQRRQKARDLALEQGMTFIHAFEEPAVMAGQGTSGLEILEDLPETDVVLVPIGGGGLLGGIATAIKESKPGTKVIGVEPVGSNSMYSSLQAGRVVQLEKTTTSADGLRSHSPGELTFATAQRYVDDVILVSEEAIKVAMLLLMERGKLLAEPSGAATVAALLEGKVSGNGQKVVAVISGGNVDLELVAQLIQNRRELESLLSLPRSK